MAQVLRAIAVDTVGIVASADEHGAEQRAEVEAVPLLVLEHGGRGVQVQGLGTAGWSVQPPPLPLTSLPRAGRQGQCAGSTPMGLLPFAGLGSLLRMG